MHWTAIVIAPKAGEFLTIPNASVLDIGSGVGKFCLVAGFLSLGNLLLRDRAANGIAHLSRNGQRRN